MPDQAPYRRPVLDHLGLVAGMFDELGMGEVVDQALDLVPSLFQNQPTSRLISPRVAPGQLNDDALGRALNTLYGDGVTALYRLMATTAAKRLGRAPHVAPLDRTSVHADGRDNSDDEPAEQVIPITRGDRRDHRPDLNHVMLELIVEPQAGIPVLMKPLSGTSSDAHDFGEVIRAHVHQWHLTYGMTSVVADSALYREANLQQLAQTPMKWITRVPATFSDAQAALAHVDPQAMAALTAHYRYCELPSLNGGVQQRWVLIYSELRQTQAQRTVDQQLRKQSDQEGKAWKQ
jgi:transposase